MASGNRMFELLEMRPYAAGTYYSNPEFNALLGQAERLVLHSIVTAIGTGIAVDIEDSADNENFATVTSSAISSTAVETKRYATSTTHARYVRLKVVVTGTVTFSVRATPKSA